MSVWLLRSRTYISFCPDRIGATGTAVGLATVDNRAAVRIEATGGGIMLTVELHAADLVASLMGSDQDYSFYDSLARFVRVLRTNGLRALYEMSKNGDRE
jgi:hypothetical protein